jgi:hypothetical protein
MLPNIYRQQRLQAMSNGVSALDVFMTSNFPFFSTSQPQPLPNWANAAVANSFLHASTVPKEASIVRYVLKHLTVSFVVGWLGKLHV